MNKHKLMLNETVKALRKVISLENVKEKKDF